MPLSLDLSSPGDRPTSRHVRQNANLLSDLLNEAIAYLDGEDAAKLVATARSAASQETPDGEAPRLDHLFADLSSDQAIFLARALASHSMLANIGEDVAGRRRHAEGDAKPGDERPRTLVDAVKALVAEGKSPAELTKVLAAMGSKLITQELLDAGDYAGITKKVRETVDLIKKVRGKA